MSLLTVNEVGREIGAVTILQGVTVRVAAGERIGLVGPNGAGKTTLLRMMLGRDVPDYGTINRARNLRVEALAQESAHDPKLFEAATIADAVRGGAVEIARLASELRSAEVDGAVSSPEYAAARQRFDALEGYTIDDRVAAALRGLGFPNARHSESPRLVSGGELTRVALARLVIADPDLLLLDEPTNHLDIDAKTWLMRFLSGYRGALIVVSHDLALLDAAITRIVHLDRDGVVQYRGTYSQYREARRRDEERLRALASRQAAEIERLQRLADSMRGSTEKRARKAKTLDTRVARMRRDAVTGPRRERKVAYRFPDPPHAGKLVLETAGLTKGYGADPVFEDVTFDVGRGERLLVMGLNGAGKTSLLRILAGVTEADAGTFRLGSGVSLGYYAQEHEGIVPGRTVFSHVRESAVDADDQALRSLLGMFGLTGEVAHQDAGTLSGGEKTKLALAQLVAGRRNLVLLDEPTNNLDPPSRTAIAEALTAWPGSMLIVSHDVEFVAALAPERVLTMPEGEVVYWNDDLLDLVALA